MRRSRYALWRMLFPVQGDVIDLVDNLASFLNGAARGMGCRGERGSILTEPRSASRQATFHGPMARFHGPVPLARSLWPRHLLLRPFCRLALAPKRKNATDLT